MAARDIWLSQENAGGKFDRVLLSPTAAKHNLSLGAGGVPVVTASSANIPASAATAAVAIDVANMDDGSANNVLIGLDTATGVYTVGEASAIEQNFDKLADEINTLKILTDELQAKLNLALVALAAQNITQ